VNATDEVTAYVDAVRAALADLTDELRTDLLDDLPEHLREVLSEGDGSLVDRLGSPQPYAAELRAAAGIVGGFPDPPAKGRFAELAATARANLAVVDARLGPLLGYASASEFLQLLRPAWWVLRGYLAAMVLARIVDDSGQPMGLLPRVGGSEALALLMLGAAVLGSVWLGRRPAPRAAAAARPDRRDGGAGPGGAGRVRRRRQHRPRIVLFGRAVRQPVQRDQ
jgi:hypothetical protein